MSGELEVTHEQDLHEVTVMQGGRGRIETAIEGDRTRSKMLTKSINIGVLGDEASPLEFIENIGHGKHPFFYGSRKSIPGSKLISGSRKRQ